MPQLDVSTFFSQVFWFLVLFFLLFFVVSFLFLPKLDKIISTRNKKVLDTFESSIYLLRLIESQTIKYNATLKEARAKARIIMNDALAQVEEMRTAFKFTLKQEDEKVSKLVKRQVAQFRSEYNGELKKMVTGIALIYYSKLTNLEIEEKFVATLVGKEF